VVVNFDNNSVKTNIHVHVSADSTEGLQQEQPYSLSYKYDKTTCTLRAWETTLGTSNSDLFFVVGNNGAVLYGVQQDVGDNESKLFVLTKQ
ncbi:MAG: hypothetical protein EBR59_00355, partial [Methylococcaceae bacterium]|nr:hypothetical protein [Methylococcaceae bacterium]